MQILTNALSGTNMVHDVGFMDGAMSGSLDQLVLCDEIIGYARRIREGINFDEKSFALDLIDEVGPGGEYITTGHTFRHFKKELWRPTLLDRNPYEGWAQEGRKDMRTRVHEKTAGILATHRCQPLPDEVAARLDEVAARLDVIWMRAQKRMIATA